MARAARMLGKIVDLKSALAAVALLAALGACGAPARPDAMIPESVAPLARSSPLFGAIALGEVSGGEETELLSPSKVGDRELAEAVRRSLAGAGYLSADEARAAFRLTVFLVGLKHPRAGLATLTVNSVVRYTLLRVDGGDVVFDDRIVASHSATMDDTVIVFKRRRLANEGSIRANIAAFLERLGRLDPRKPARR